MKKLYILPVAATIFASLLNPAEAAYRKSVGKGNFSFDSYIEYNVVDTDMKSTTGIITPANLNSLFDTPVKRKILMFNGSYGVIDQLDVFAGVGVVDDELEGDRFSNNTDDYTQSDLAPMYEVGIKGTAYENDKYYVAYLAKYRYAKTGSDFAGPNVPEKAEILVDTYNVDLELGYKYNDKVTPYVGISAMDYQFKQKLDNYVAVPNYDSTFESERNISAFAGFNYKASNKVNINAEVSQGAKESISAGINYKF